MFGLGMGHMLLLAAIALIAIGPKQLPEVARMIGRFLNDMKKVRDEFTRSITDTRDNINTPFQSTYTPPPYQVDVAAQHAIEATENRADGLSSTLPPAFTPPSPPAPPAPLILFGIDELTALPAEPALDEHNQIAFDLSTSVDDGKSIAAETQPDRKDH